MNDLVQSTIFAPIRTSERRRACLGHAAAALDGRGIAYLHLVEATGPGLPQSPPDGAAPLMPVVRRRFRGPLIVNGGYDKDSANAVIAAGAADLVAFAALFIANPDLVTRFRRDASLNPPDPATFHQGGAKGYVDYPMLASA
jgi:N-ethylmaleimide reductase